MLRLEIKYLQSFIKNTENPDENVFDKLKGVIEQFRRLKFRMEKRHQDLAEGELAFPEHYAFGKRPDKI